MIHTAKKRTPRETLMPKILTRYWDARVRRHENPDENSAAYQDANAEIWAATLDAIKLHRTEGVPIDPEMALELEFELEHWVSGIPSPNLPLLTTSGRKISPDVRSCILTAVMYLVASPKLTEDRSARKTVREQFHIVPSTLQRWVNQHQTEAKRDLARFRKRVRNEEISSRLEVLLATSGRRYQFSKKREKTKRA